MECYEAHAHQIREGLVTTHPITKCRGIIDREVGEIGLWFETIYDEEKNVFSAEFDGIPSSVQMEYLCHVVGVLGYYPSYMFIQKRNWGWKSFPWTTIEEYTEKTRKRPRVRIHFESRFDEVLKWCPTHLYHCTEVSNLYRISKQGIKPAYSEKGDFRPERIFLSLSMRSAQAIKRRMIFHNTTQGRPTTVYTILEINPSTIPGLVLYKDPRSDGTYSYNHIGPRSLRVVE